MQLRVREFTTEVVEVIQRRVMATYVITEYLILPTHNCCHLDFALWLSCLLSGSFKVDNIYPHVKIDIYRLHFRFWIRILLQIPASLLLAFMYKFRVLY